jgi:UPF0755 protein
MSGEQPPFQNYRQEPRRIRSPRDALVPEQLPPPPSARVRNPFVVAGNAIFSGLLLLILAAGGAIYFGKQKLEAAGPLERDRTVVIESRKGVREIADTLKRDGVIDQTLPFIVGSIVLGVKDELKAGEYLFEAHSSMAKVLQTMVEGRSLQYSVTIPEGLTTQQIVQRLKDSTVLTGDIGAVPPEGSLLPETYKVTRGTTREQVLQRMANAHKRLVDEIWAKRAPDLPIKTPEELVTLASIVEKETGKADERARVAGVFVNRLRKRMRLQSDPTIVYGLMGGKGPLGRPLLKVEMDEKNPYNTYQIDGLPPGPIANPGRASLEAAAHPMKSNELYFVADGTGGHVFAETLDEHAKNVAKWRGVEREQNAAANAPAEPVQPAPATQAAAPAEAAPPPKPAGPLTSPRTHVAPKKKAGKKSDARKDKHDTKKQAAPAGQPAAAAAPKQ